MLSDTSIWLFLTRSEALTIIREVSYIIIHLKVVFLVLIDFQLYVLPILHKLASQGHIYFTTLKHERRIASPISGRIWNKRAKYLTYDLKMNRLLNHGQIISRKLRKIKSLSFDKMGHFRSNCK